MLKNTGPLTLTNTHSIWYLRKRVLKKFAHFGHVHCTASVLLAPCSTSISGGHLFGVQAPPTQRLTRADHGRSLEWIVMLTP